MREKELRLALVCYGGISLAVYMHGVTKEIWRLVAASRAEHDGAAPSAGVEAAYRDLLTLVAASGGTRLRVLADIVAGASAGGINGIFLARAMASGESLDPLTDLWLTRADVTVLLDPDARPFSRFTKFWAVPIAWLFSRTPRNTIDSTVERSARAEVRAKLSQFVRARWFAPPFGGEVFSSLLLDAFDAMGRGPKGPPLIPASQPVDLMVTVTDFTGHEEIMRLNSPPLVLENEHRLIFGFRHATAGRSHLDDVVGLTFAARATASFPGAFPPFTVRELDRALTDRGREWPERDAFLARQLPSVEPQEREDRVLVDGSVLANAPFRPAISVLRQRPARREVDRRFVYIDPKPGRPAVTLGGKGRADAADGKPALPGFFAAIFKSISDIPREQPIRDNVEALDGLSTRARRMLTIVNAMRPQVEERVEAALGRTFFLDKPTPDRLSAWRTAVQERAVQEAGYSFVAYSQLKLSLIVEDVARMVAEIHDARDDAARLQWRAAVWAAVRSRDIDRIEPGVKKGAVWVHFFKQHDLGFRIRRLRHMARRLDELNGTDAELTVEAMETMRSAIFDALGPLLDREASEFHAALVGQDGDMADAGAIIDAIAQLRDLPLVDRASDALLAEGLRALPKGPRRAMIHAYLGFAFFDAATLPLLQGEGQGEFEPIKIDRISPDDAVRLRAGGTEATLKGIQFNSFGAFFSRAFRENDYLWGRLHAVERLFSIVASAASTPIDGDALDALLCRAFTAILDEEEERLTRVPDLFSELRALLKEKSGTA